MSHLSSLFNSKVLVVGDVMLDGYWHGDTHRISPEAPVPVVNIHHFEYRAGGASNVALNVGTLGATVTLMGVIGKDESARRLKEALKQSPITCDFVEQPDMTTITKYRVIGRHQQLLRLDLEEKLTSCQSLLDAYVKQLKHHQVVILSDYAKGALASPTQFIREAKTRHKLVLVDPKDPDLSHYQGADMITPNLNEFEAMVGPCSHQQILVEKGLNLVQSLKLPYLLVTQGDKGMTLFERQTGQVTHLPANAKEVYDITGAGDTVIATMGAFMGAGFSPLESAKWANISAGIVVGKMGTALVQRHELEAVHQGAQQPGINEKCLSLKQLLSKVEDLKRLNQKIIMTNGCFDILHEGHVTYLEQAKALGDVLIVAINSDSSVKRLKGCSRPVHPLPSRMKVMSALQSVDFVVSFDEETPENLIAQVLPDCLVKGGDYQPEQVAGGQQVIQNKGQVVILPLVPGHSTTQILEKSKALEVV